MLIFVSELATAVSAFIYKAELSKGFKEGLSDAMEKYAANQNKRDAVDGIQSTLGCCGSDSYEDWYEIDWSGGSEGSGAADSGGGGSAVPMSCCNVTTAEQTCDNTLTDDIYTAGCFAKLSSFMESNFLMIGGIAIGFSFLQLFGAVLAYCLAKNINRAKYEQMA